ncbi:MAG: monovalent cation/H+ antiporter complex subunit F [Candidatus Cryosericum sp.]
MMTLNLIYVAVVALSMALTTIRMIKGPDTSNRAMALDVLTTVSVSVLVFFALFFDRRIYVDVGLVYAVLSFIGVLVIARFLERGI